MIIGLTSDAWSSAQVERNQEDIPQLGRGRSSPSLKEQPRQVKSHSNAGMRDLTSLDQYASHLSIPPQPSNSNGWTNTVID